MDDAPIVQRTGDSHHQIRPSIFGIAQDVFDNATPLDAGQGVFNPNAGAGYAPVAALVRAC